ncbi:MAG: hypothetical protein Q4C47_02740, partial [Planctomycetia bacterium]|nr:hypothetical protein [Planctomycetia bacterium]
MSPIVESLVNQLDGLRQRWWLFSLLTTVTLGFATSLGVFFSLMLLDALCRFSRTGLALCAFGWLAVTVYSGLLIVRRLLRNDRTIDGTARIVENEFPQLESRLINVVQLSRKLRASTTEPVTAFEVAAVRRAAAEVDRDTLAEISSRFGRLARFRRCMQTPGDWGESLVLLAVVLVFAVVIAHRVPAWSSSANRLLQPWNFRPAIGLVGPIRVTPGDTNVLVDSDLEILAEIDNPTGKEWTGTLYVTEESGTDTSGVRSVKNAERAKNAGSGKDDTDGGERIIPLVAEEGYTRFRATIPSIAHPLRYRLEIGDSQSEAYQVNVDSPVTSGDIAVTYHYPGYLERADESVEPRRIADLEAPQYTTATLTIGISRRVDRCVVELDDAPVNSDVTGRGMNIGGTVETEKTSTDTSGGTMKSDSDTALAGRRKTPAERTPTRLRAELDETGTTATTDVPMVRNGTFRILFYIGSEQVNRDPRRNRITVRPDRPPVAELTAPATDLVAKPGEAIPVKFRVRDDHALGRARLLVRVKRA